MNGRRIVKPIICLAGLLCFLLPFVSVDVSLAQMLGELGAFLPGQSVGVSGVLLIGVFHFLIGPLFGLSAQTGMIAVGITLWLGIPFILTALMGVRSLIREDRVTKWMILIASGLNFVMSAVLLFFVTASVESGVGIEVGGGLGLWLFLLLNIALFVLGVLQKEEAVQERPAAGAARPAAQRSGGSLVGINGQYSGATIPMEPGAEVVIGRDAASCSLIVSGPKVSRRHCSIKYDSMTGAYNVVDYSSNGTYTSDGKRLPAGQAAPLAKGSFIYLGDQSVMFRLD